MYLNKFLRHRWFYSMILALFRQSRGVLPIMAVLFLMQVCLYVDKCAVKLGLAFALNYFNFVNGHNLRARNLNLLSCIYINVSWTLVWHPLVCNSFFVLLFFQQWLPWTVSNMQIVSVTAFCRIYLKVWFHLSLKKVKHLIVLNLLVFCCMYFSLFSCLKLLLHLFWFIDYNYMQLLYITFKL